MQYQHFFQSIIEDFKIGDGQSLLRPLRGSLAEMLCDRELVKETLIMYQHKSRDFKELEIGISYNSLICNEEYIELSRTTYELKYTKSKHQDGIYIMILQNNLGKEMMIASSQTQFMRIQIFLKRYCMNKNFLSKYQLVELGNCLPTAISHKNQEQHCLLVQEKRHLLTQSDVDIFHNSITIQHALQNNPILQKIYEDSNRYYLICTQMKLQSLESLLMNGFELKEVPLVSVIFMILQTLQKYNNKGIYHGNINLSNVYFNIQSPILQIAILYPLYSQTSDQTIQDDLNAVALLLYQITFFIPKEKIKQQIDKEMIMICRNIMCEQNRQKEYKFLYRVSQLDLLLQLLDSRTNIEKALRHQWFVTIKLNLKMEQRGNVHKSSLQTIIEQNETSMTQSQYNEMKSKFKQKVEYVNDSNEEVEEVEEENPQRESLRTVNPFLMIPSKVKHDTICRQFQQSKTFSELSRKRPSILDTLQALNKLQTFQ